MQNPAEDDPAAHTGQQPQAVLPNAADLLAGVGVPAARAAAPAVPGGAAAALAAGDGGRVNVVNDPRGKLRIAVQGCAHGELDSIYATIAEMERSQRLKIDLLLCCGDFQAVRFKSDLECMAVPAKFRRLGTFYRYCKKPIRQLLPSRPLRCVTSKIARREQTRVRRLPQSLQSLSGAITRPRTTSRSSVMAAGRPPTFIFLATAAWSTFEDSESEGFREFLRATTFPKGTLNDRRTIGAPCARCTMCVSTTSGNSTSCGNSSCEGRRCKALCRNRWMCL